MNTLNPQDAKTSSSSSEPSYTFYRDCFCARCGIQVSVPVQHTLSEILHEEKREGVLTRLKNGEKLRWPYEVMKDEDAEKIAKSGKCPNNPDHRLEYIWNLGGA